MNQEMTSSICKDSFLRLRELMPTSHACGLLSRAACSSKQPCSCAFTMSCSTAAWIVHDDWHEAVGCNAFFCPLQMGVPG